VLIPMQLVSLWFRLEHVVGGCWLAVTATSAHVFAVRSAARLP
jgi:hypothetical protein